MADKMASRISVGLLAAVTMSLVLQPAMLARDGFSGGSGGARSYIPGTHYGGYPIGTQSAGQYAGNNIGRSYGMNHADAGPWWWYGGGGYGAGVGSGVGLGGMNDSSNQLLYPTADGPQPTTAPVPSYQTEMADTQVTERATPHVDGPSMSLAPDSLDMPKASSYFKGFWNDINMGGAGQVQQQPQLQLAANTADQETFAHPRVQSRLSPVQFNSSAAVRSELTPKLQEAEQMFIDLKQQGKLGTFDLEPLEKQWRELKRRAGEVDTIQNSTEQQTEEGHLINDIADFEFQLKGHIDTP